MKKKYNKTLLTLFIISSITTLTACGGGGSDSESKPPQPPKPTVKSYNLRFDGNTNESSYRNYYSPEKVPFTLSINSTNTNLNLSKKTTFDSSIKDTKLSIPHKDQLIKYLNELLHDPAGDVPKSHKNITIKDVEFTSNTKGYLTLQITGKSIGNYFNFDDMILNLTNNQNWRLDLSSGKGDVNPIDNDPDDMQSVKLNKNAKTLTIENKSRIIPSVKDYIYYDSNHIILDIDFKENSNSANFIFTNCDEDENTNINEVFTKVKGKDHTYKYSSSPKEPSVIKYTDIITPKTINNCTVSYLANNMDKAYLMKINK
ncbi:hypothetical protein CF386_07790 [Paraphotobacterium marinum]|uniref:Lipoprotein n=1 Tax=Paraphotobacterium marinum TaxID=1755811 RepID=A0A220VFC2_9GAMM|nr:hypothetical protein [Paraphotobacterium marinum]ASK78960.1 hypothetical protein CF386_07790 [Paraphotobacterium marinum]